MNTGRCSLHTLAAIVFAAWCCLGAGCFQSDECPVPIVDSGTSTQEPERRPAAAGPRKESEVLGPSGQASQAPSKSVILRPDDRGKPEPAGSPPPTTERIPGYRARSEYFLLKSRSRGETVAAVTLPLDYARTTKKYPLVIAFGGAGECAKAPREGALAWLRYYKGDDAIAALNRHTLNKDDFRGLVTPGQLQLYNDRLHRFPYKGIILVCPASPPLFGSSEPEFPDYEEYIMDELIPALKARYRAAPGAVGVDGVSMGGARAMYYGLKYPEVFTAIGSSQGAFGPFMDIYRHFAKENGALLRNRSIQLITSDKDVLAPSVQRMHLLLKEFDIPHEYRTLTGPHDYIFNQGPGVLSLLIFHNSALNAGQGEADAKSKKR